ncbi:hypothetical protein [Aquimarina sp. I32.4]|uniref:hypothetical protein n=1 Tax=Aquimarina sp. I32.4 TaxID=2053903 RepID=UPI000CDEE97C|nr:hypothetical protein [Aquimarina sp. I32.4]
MKTIAKKGQQLNRFRIFEATVFNYLLVNPQLFDTCVNKHAGYALLLRLWIEEKYTNGNTAIEVAEMIQQSKLCIESIKSGNPLSTSVQ